MTNSYATVVPRYTEGYLINPQDWNKTIACTLAAEEGIELNNDNWSAIDLMREYHDEHSIAPEVPHSIDYLADKRHRDKRRAKKLIVELFPYDYLKQACKIIGMMRPRAWSSG